MCEQKPLVLFPGNRKSSHLLLHTYVGICFLSFFFFSSFVVVVCCVWVGGGTCVFLGGGLFLCFSFGWLFFVCFSEGGGGGVSDVKR